MLPLMQTKTKKLKRSNLQFGGLNLCESAEAGEVRDSIGVSSRAFPYISVCGGRERIESCLDPVDMFEYDGRLAVVDGDTLRYDGQEICKVQRGKKQFAVVNKTLCIFPDKIAVDLSAGKVSYMERSMNIDTAHNPTDLRSGGLTVTPVRQLTESGSEQKFERTGLSGPFAYTCTYTYGKDKTAVEKCFSRGGWTSLHRLEELKDVCYNNTGNHIEVGDIMIPEITAEGTIRLVGEPYKLQSGVIPEQYYPDRSRYNTEGYYCVITSYITDLDRGADTWITYDVYKTDGADVLFEGAFAPGDSVCISGTPFGMKDAGNVAVQGIDKITNALIFEPESIRDVGYYYILPQQQPGNKPMTLVADGRYVTFTPTDAIDSGSMLCMGSVRGEDGASKRKTTVFLWDEVNRREAAQFEAAITDDWTEGCVQAQTYSLSGTITVKKPLPDLDYICESGNRLWGVSAAENRVYASRAGQVDSFYDTEGKDGAWSMSFGSEDRFTAICAFGGGVCCFKETKLHKILGTTRSQFSVNDYSIEGVQQGCEKSLQIWGDTLYYKGVHGVYAYSGASPKLISRQLGSTPLLKACAGTDGRIYYLSGVSGGEGVRYAYDLLHKIWLKEAAEQTHAFACADGEIYMLCSGGVYKTGTSDKTETEFAVEFAPITEDTLAKKSYQKLLLRLQMAKNSCLHVYLKCDGGEMYQVYTHVASCDTVITVPIRPHRCDSFTIRLEGKGDIKLTGMQRECALLSEV
ncbi:MAG: hypothetical protein IKT81_02655 [Clostridia bacterium]|nr:hypothetical protein [Clostridia bacterium]